MVFAHEHLQERRVLAGLSRSELARRTGTTRESIRRYETGASTPRPSTAMALAAALTIPPADLWTRELAA